MLSEENLKNDNVVISGHPQKSSKKYIDKV